MGVPMDGVEEELIRCNCEKFGSGEVSIAFDACDGDDRGVSGSGREMEEEYGFAPVPKSCSASV